MVKIAVIKTGGKQYLVKEGQSLLVEKLAKPAGQSIKLETLLIADGEKVNLGAPSLGDKVEAKIISGDKQKKVLVIKYKNKTRYKRTLGHRQPYTKIEIKKIA